MVIADSSVYFDPYDVDINADPVSHLRPTS